MPPKLHAYFTAARQYFSARQPCAVIIFYYRRSGETEGEIHMAKPITLTTEGLKKLENEYETLTTITRKEVAEKIKVARSFGDLSENSEYDEAKNEQAKVEARINELEAMLKNYTIIDEGAIDGTKVHLGSKVKVRDLEMKEELEYTIVGSAEADPMNGTISDESPVGKALIGAKVGQTVVAEAPAGEIKFKVISISR